MIAALLNVNALSFEKLEMVEEAAQKIRRYYRNVYKYGPGAKTICELLLKNKVSCVLIQTETKAFFSSTRSGSRRLR